MHIPNTCLFMQIEFILSSRPKSSSVVSVSWKRASNTHNLRGHQIYNEHNHNQHKSFKISVNWCTHTHTHTHTHARTHAHTHTHTHIHTHTHTYTHTHTHTHNTYQLWIGGQVGLAKLDEQRPVVYHDLRGGGQLKDVPKECLQKKNKQKKPCSVDRASIRSLCLKAGSQ